MYNMRVLFLVSPNSPLVKSGPLLGSAQQVQMLRRNLERLGHETGISGELVPDYTGWDVAHLTMIDYRATEWQYRASYRRLPLVVKTLNSWSLDPWLDDLAAVAAALTIESPDEGLMLHHRFGKLVAGKTYSLLPAVDKEIVCDDTPWDDRVYVHINGSYDRNKGHATVIAACKKLGFPVVTAGPPVDREVHGECLALGYGEVYGEMSKARLSSVYNRTRVYVCASEKEICLTSICEAIKCGCNVVSSSTNWGNSNYDKPGFWTYQYNSLKDLTEKIEAAYSYPQQQNTYWSEERLALEYFKIFENCIHAFRRQ